MFGNCEKPIPPNPYNRRPYPSNPPDHMGPAVGSDYCSKRMREYRMKKVDCEKKEDVEGDAAKVKLYNLFFEKVDHKLLMNGLVSKVNQGIQAYDADLNRKRERLRLFLLSEEEALKKEFVDEMQRGGESRFKDKIKKAEEIKARNEVTRLEVLKQKRLQLYMQNCEDVKPKISYEVLLETKRSQLKQMEDKRKLQQMEKDYNKLWEIAMQRSYDAQVEKECKMYCERKRLDTCMKELLDSQMAAKQLEEREKQLVKLEEQRKLEEYIEQVKQEELNEKMKKAQIREHFRQDVVKQQKIDEFFKQGIKKEAELIETKYDALANDEISRANKSSDKARLNKEMATYMKAMEEYKVKRMEVDKATEQLMETDRIIQNEKVIAIECEKRRKLRLLAEAVQSGRGVQIREKACRKKMEAIQEKEAALLNDQIRGVNYKLNDELIKRKREEAIKFGEQQQQLIKEHGCRKEKEKFEDDRYNLLLMKEFEDRTKLCAEIAQGQGVMSMEKHPFLQVMLNSCKCDKTYSSDCPACNLRK